MVVLDMLYCMVYYGNKFMGKRMIIVGNFRENAIQMEINAFTGDEKRNPN